MELYVVILQFRIYLYLDMHNLQCIRRAQLAIFNCPVTISIFQLAVIVFVGHKPEVHVNGIWIYTKIHIINALMMDNAIKCGI